MGLSRKYGMRIRGLGLLLMILGGSFRSNRGMLGLIVGLDVLGGLERVGGRGSLLLR